MNSLSIYNKTSSNQSNSIDLYTSINNDNLLIDNMNIYVVNWIITSNIKKEKRQSFFCIKCGNYILCNYNKNLLCNC